MTNQQILRRLRLEFILYVLLAALLMVLYETHVFVEGSLVGNASGVYVAESAGILLTIVLVPVALKSFHNALVRMVYMDDDEARRRCYVKWSEVRLAMFVAVVLVNLSVYYMTVDNMCGYCALIGAIASLFCWPTKEGVATELTMKEEPIPEPQPEATEEVATTEDEAIGESEAEEMAASEGEKNE